MMTTMLMMTLSLIKIIITSLPTNPTISSTPTSINIINFGPNTRRETNFRHGQILFSKLFRHGILPNKQHPRNLISLCWILAIGTITIILIGIHKMLIYRRLGWERFISHRGIDFVIIAIMITLSAIQSQRQCLSKPTEARDWNGCGCHGTGDITTGGLFDGETVQITGKGFCRLIQNCLHQQFRWITQRLDNTNRCRIMNEIKFGKAAMVFGHAVLFGIVEKVLG